jgi:hypothetical protein
LIGAAGLHHGISHFVFANARMRESLDRFADDWGNALEGDPGYFSLKLEFVGP